MTDAQTTTNKIPNGYVKSSGEGFWKKELNDKVSYFYIEKGIGTLSMPNEGFVDFQRRLGIL